MNSKLFKTGLIKVDPNQEVDLEPIIPESEIRGAIHGTVKGTEGKVCIAKLFKVTKEEGKNRTIVPVAFQYVDDWGQFLFPIVDTGINVRYVVKVFCLAPEECIIDPAVGTDDEE